jgi:diguanylate cyclase (GGDEF)-like protein
MKPVDFTELKVSLIAACRVTSLHRELHQQKLELERLNLELREQARRDPLTHLYNRLRLREDFDALRHRMQRYGSPCSVVLCDIDHFKDYNDHYGHLAGDEALRRVAQAFADECRASDLAYRYGGEEFLVLLPEQSLHDAVTAAERLRRAVERLRIPHHATDSQGVLTVSVGVAAADGNPFRQPEALVKEADLALYRAKTSGKNIVIAHTCPHEDVLLAG